MHYFVDVLKRYAVFTGRARRAEYWYFTLFSIIVSIVLSIISEIIGDSKNIIGSLYSLAVLLPGIAVGIRRLHDIGKSGWWMLINFIPIAGWIWFIVLACKESTPGDNKYGPNPKNIPSPTPPQTPNQEPQVAQQNPQ